MTNASERDPRLAAYLRRTGFEGPVAPNLETLTRLHRAHLTGVSYENLDIHLGRALSLDPDLIYRKIVIDGRGGWCFEMNTLFRWALETIGFRVTLLSGTAAYENDHMVLAVDVDGGRYLADMGWGNGFLDPLPLVEGPHRQGHRRFDLSRKGESWRFSNLDFGDDGFTFSLTPRTQGFFSEPSRFLQTHPESSFVRVVKAFRFDESGRLQFLRGAVLLTVGAQGKSTREIASAAEYETVWREVFESPLADIASLWPKVHEAHVAWAQAKAQ